MKREAGDGFAMLLELQNTDRRFVEEGGHNMPEKRSTDETQEDAQLIFDRAQIGRRLKMVRVGMKLTQKEMGELLDISWRTYQNYEVGHRVLPLSTACQFASIANVPIEWLALGTTLKFEGVRSSDVQIELSVIDR